MSAVESSLDTIKMAPYVVAHNNAQQKKENEPNAISVDYSVARLPAHN